MNTATAHDALTELTTIFTNAEIGEVLDVAPETVSRLKNHDRDPRGEVARRLDAFHYVVHRALSRMGGDGRAVRWAIFRRQEMLDGGTVAALLREQEVDRALAVLDALPSPSPETAEDLTVSDELEAALLAMEQQAPVVAVSAPANDAERFLAEHSDINGLLPHLVDGVLGYLGDAEVALSVAADEFSGDELVVEFQTDLSVEEAGDRMRLFYAERWDELVAAYADRISIAVA